VNQTFTAAGSDQTLSHVSPHSLFLDNRTFTISAVLVIGAGEKRNPSERSEVTRDVRVAGELLPAFVFAGGGSWSTGLDYSGRPVEN
jgi:hypothetical protein